MGEYTHFDADGRPTLVDVSGKSVTKRTAWAEGWLYLPDEIYKTVSNGAVKKGDPFSIAELGGIMGAKRTPDLIPLCHTIRLDNVKVRCELDHEKKALKITCEATASEVTGVEMEALTGVSVAALTFYDMCKGIDKGMIIKDIRLLRKTGGKSGEWNAGKGLRRMMRILRLYAPSLIGDHNALLRQHKQGGKRLHQRRSRRRCSGARAGEPLDGEERAAAMTVVLPPDAKLNEGDFLSVGKYGATLLRWQDGHFRVCRAGFLGVSEPAEIWPAIRTAVLTVSDKGSRGEREDTAGPELERLAFMRGCVTEDKKIVPRRPRGNMRRRHGRGPKRG